MPDSLHHWMGLFGRMRSYLLTAPDHHAHLAAMQRQGREVVRLGSYGEGFMKGGVLGRRLPDSGQLAKASEVTDR